MYVLLYTFILLESVSGGEGLPGRRSEVGEGPEGCEAAGHEPRSALCPAQRRHLVVAHRVAGHQALPTGQLLREAEPHRDQDLDWTRLCQGPRAGPRAWSKHSGLHPAVLATWQST